MWESSSVSPSASELVRVRRKVAYLEVVWVRIVER